MISPVTADGAFILRVSVIIPAINEAAHIAGAIASAQNAGADEIIVADGGSTDETRERVGNASLVLAPAGRAKQQNVGAAAASGEVLLFLHADARLAATSIEEMRSACCKQKSVWGAFHQRIDAAGIAYRLLEQGNAARVRWRGIAYGDQGVWVRREAFDAVGGFPNVPLLEDLLLSRSLRRMAIPMLLAGPLTISARRWQKHGTVRQTLRNWAILAAHASGASLEKLAERYRRHDR